MPMFYGNCRRMQIGTGSDALRGEGVSFSGARGSVYVAPDSWSDRLRSERAVWVPSWWAAALHPLRQSAPPRTLRHHQRSQGQRPTSPPLRPGERLARRNRRLTAAKGRAAEQPRRPLVPARDDSQARAPCLDLPALRELCHAHVQQHAAVDWLPGTPRRPSGRHLSVSVR